MYGQIIVAIGNVGSIVLPECVVGSTPEFLLCWIIKASLAASIGVLAHHENAIQWLASVASR